MKITQEGWAILENDTHIGIWIEQEKRLDFDQNALPQMLPFVKNDMNVIDIGANVGAYSYAFAHKTSKKVYCFEPYKPSYECLVKNMENLVNVKCFNKALSSFSGMGSIELLSDNIGTASLKKGSDFEVVTLDELKIPNVGFIKMDQEGCEYKTLLGGVKTIEKYKPNIIIEINTWALNNYGSTPKDISLLLDSLEYNYRNIYKEQKMEGLQYDIIATPI